MTLEPTGALAGAFGPQAAPSPRESFRALLESPCTSGGPRAQAPVPVRTPEQGMAVEAARELTGPAVEAGRWVEGVRAAQAQLEHVLALAQAGRHFTPVELLGLQAQVYQASQALDLAGKVVEKAVGGVKQVLQTQL